MKKYVFYLFLIDMEEPVNINVELPNVFTVEDSLKFSIKIFNAQYSNNSQ
jgi:hypothetical protein